jgi:hypothetical protein
MTSPAGAVALAVELLRLIADDPLMRPSYRQRARRYLDQLGPYAGAEPIPSRSNEAPTMDQQEPTKPDREGETAPCIMRIGDPVGGNGAPFGPGGATTNPPSSEKE